MKDLKRRIFVGSVWNAVGTGARHVVSLLIFIYVARRLTPADVGLVALAMVFIDLAKPAARWGQVELIQRTPGITDRAISTSFWMLIVGGLILAMLIAAGAQLSITYLDLVLFGTVLTMLAPIAWMQALTAVPEAVLKRRFDYRSLTIRSWLATVIGGLTGGYLAFRGYGVYALVAQRLTTAVVQTVASWALLRWRPRFEFDTVGASGLARRGAEIMGGSIAGAINQGVAQGIVGFGLGATILGFLRLGSRFFDFATSLAVQPVSTVALSTFSQLQHDRDAMKRAFVRLSQFMALASYPMFFGLGAVADIFVPFVFSAKWSGAIVVMQMLVFTRLPAPISYFFGPAMLAVGKNRVVLRQATTQVLLTIALISAGAFFGLVGVLIAIVIRGFVMSIYNLRALNREIGLDTFAILEVITPPAAASIVMFLVVELAKHQFAGMHDAWLMVVMVAIGAATYGSVLLIGDAAGLWRGYCRGVMRSLAGAIGRRRLGAAATASPT